MRSIIAYCLMIPLLYNMINFVTKRQKLAIKYKDPNHNEEFTVKGIGEEYEKELKKLTISFLIVDFIILIFIVLLFI
jgi:hypothetical protein